jgi:hypothetical protein
LQPVAVGHLKLAVQIKLGSRRLVETEQPVSMYW